MSKAYKIAEREYQLSEAPSENEAIRLIEIDEQSHELQVELSMSGRQELLLDGLKHSLRTAKCPEGIWVWSKGQAWLVAEGGSSGRRRGSADAGGQALVTPATPGVVVRILVNVGDKVQKGDELVVVAAMKMESPLCAGYPGEVTAINTEEGANVKPGDILVELEAEETEKEESHE